MNDELPLTTKILNEQLILKLTNMFMFSLNFLLYTYNRLLAAADSGLSRFSSRSTGFSNNGTYISKLALNFVVRLV